MAIPKTCGQSLTQVKIRIEQAKEITIACLYNCGRGVIGLAAFSTYTHAGHQLLA